MNRDGAMATTAVITETAKEAKAKRQRRRGCVEKGSLSGADWRFPAQTALSLSLLSMATFSFAAVESAADAAQSLYE